MKFSDMMGKKDHDATEVDEPELPPEARSAPPVPEAPIRFGGPPSDTAEPVVADGVGAIAPPDAPALDQPSISDIVAELAPRPAATASDEQLDTSAWLDGINTIDDDLLPR
jgi:hypothetical protein